ncbi:hypothetical protein ACM66B_003835 [Microbotryomycetes sp. NB124-2]
MSAPADADTMQPQDAADASQLAHDDTHKPNELYPEHLVAMFYRTGQFDAIRHELLNEFKHMPELHEPITHAVEHDYFPRVFQEPHFKRISRKDRPFWVQRCFDKEQDTSLGNCTRHAEQWLGKRTDGQDDRDKVEPVPLKYSKKINKIDLDEGMRDMLAQLRQRIEDRDARHAAAAAAQAAQAGGAARSERSESIAIKAEDVDDEGDTQRAEDTADRRDSADANDEIASRTEANDEPTPVTTSVDRTEQLEDAAAQQVQEPAVLKNSEQELVQVPHKPATIASDISSSQAIQGATTPAAPVEQTPVLPAKDEGKPPLSIDTSVQQAVQANDAEPESSLSPLSPLSSDEEEEEEVQKTSAAEQVSKTTPKAAATPSAKVKGKPAATVSTRKRAAAAATDSASKSKRAKTTNASKRNSRKQSSPIMEAPMTDGNREGGEGSDAGRGSEPL